MTAVAAPDQADIRAIALDELHPHPANRKRFDKAQLAELAQSLATHGQLTPALVRPSADPAGGFELLAGERRWRAAKAAGFPTLLCLVRELDDGAALEVLAIENNQREDVHPLEEADLYKALLTVDGYDVAKIATKLHRSVSYVYNRLKLLQLGKEARKLFLAGTIQVEHAIILARLTKEQQVLAIGDEDDWVGRGNGLLEEEHTLFHPDRDEEEQADPVLKAKSPRELQAWVDEHIRFDRESDDLPQLFPETSAALAEAGQRKLKTVDITHEHYVQPEAREGGKIIGPRSWKRADGQRGSKTCDHQVLGTIAAGPGRGETFLVCIAKKTCTVHWGKEQRESKQRARERVVEGAKAGAAPRKLSPAEKREQVAAREAADRASRLEAANLDEGKGLALLAKRLLEVKLDGPSRVVKELADGVQLWGNTAQARKLVPLGAKPDQILRHFLWLAFLQEWEEEGGYAEGAELLLKMLGLTLDQYLDAVAPRPKLAPETAWCERCGCTQEQACAGGCAWDPDSWKTGKAICTACVGDTPAPKKAKGKKAGKRGAK